MIISFKEKKTSILTPIIMKICHCDKKKFEQTAFFLAVTDYNGKRDLG
jgi:hypothetical protein